MIESKKPTEAPFLARWSRRKIEAAAVAPSAPLAPLAPNASGSHLAAVPPEVGSTGASSSAVAVAGEDRPEARHPEPISSAGPQVNRDLPPIDSLTYQADFSPFMARDVDPGLRNQAMKKLFADPHYRFGEMDKLDIYIDDYSKSDPIPLDMLRQMYQAKSLFLFDDEEKTSPHALNEPAGRVDAPVPAMPAPVSFSHAADTATGDAEAAIVSSVPTRIVEKDPAKITGLADPKSGI
jgi:hypothetical protein